MQYTGDSEHQHEHIEPSLLIMDVASSLHAVVQKITIKQALSMQNQKILGGVIHLI